VLPKASSVMAGINIQSCNNPAFTIPFAYLPGQPLSNLFLWPTATEGMEFNINDGQLKGGAGGNASPAGFWGLLQGGGTPGGTSKLGTGHMKARYNGSDWVKIG